MRARAWVRIAISFELSTAACSLTLDLDEGRACTLDAECTFLARTGRCVEGRCQLPDSEGDPTGTTIGADESTGAETCGPAPTCTTTETASTAVEEGSTSGGTAALDADSGSSTGDDLFNPSCPPPYPMATSVALFDDLEAESLEVGPDNHLPQVEGRRGTWYLYNDGTGTQDPLAPDGLVAHAGGAGGSEYGARTLISGFTDWGAGYGFPLNTTPVLNCPYDVSAFDGIQFWAKGNGTWRLEVAHPSTTDASGGGICVGTCSDHFGIDVALAADWTLHEIAWEALEQGGWGETGAFEPSEVIHLQWGRDGTAEPADFEIVLDDIGPWTAP